MLRRAVRERRREGRAARFRREARAELFGPLTAALRRLALPALLLAGLPGAGHAQTGSAELAFTVGLDRHAAACTGALNDLSHARRLSGLGYGEAAWSPDGNQVALAGGKGVTNPIRIESADGRRLHAASRPRLATEDDSGPAWSPDGKTIAFSRYVFFGKHQNYGRAGVWTVDVRTRRERQLSKQFANVLAWAPDGRTIAADLGGDLEETIALLTPDGSVVRKFTVPGYKGFNGGVSWSPDGSRLAVGGGLVVDRSGSAVARYAEPSSDEAVSADPAWSPDGSTILFVRFATQIDSRTSVRYALPADLYSATVGSGHPTALTQTPNVSEGDLAFRPGANTKRAGTAQPCIFEGTSAGDVIHATSKSDLVDAAAGNDVVYGRGGNDVIDGGSGSDRLYGGSGRDEIRGGPGDDRLYARDRTADFLVGGPGRDVAFVDPKLDRISGVERIVR